MAIFTTVCCGPFGCFICPDEMKQFFRFFSMTEPEQQLITKVMLFSQGFRSAEKLACKIVQFFRSCGEVLSMQSHYNFGLQALKSLVVFAGNVVRDHIQEAKENMRLQGNTVMDDNFIAEYLPGEEILKRAVRETMVPKFEDDDFAAMLYLLSSVFSSVNDTPAEIAG